MSDEITSLGKDQGLWSELREFLSVNKRWWLLPFVATLILVLVLFVLVYNSTNSPFSYVLY